MKNIARKLVKVMKQVVKVKKSGFNKHQNYHYSTESDLIEVVRDNLLDEGILLTTSVEEVTTTETLAIVKMKHKLIDSESGEVLEMFSQGFGNLTVGKDKAVFAAQTGAFKYMLSKNFMIASEDDPENDVFSESKKETASTPTKGFTRAKTVEAVVESKVKEVDASVVIADTIPTVQVSQTAKPGFARRSTTTTKAEPNFP